jgi:hypothetical protein
MRVCYLCGLPIDRKMSQDHVPPRQFFAERLRKNQSPNLLTLPTHESCNMSYQADEDYFFVSLAGLNEDATIHQWLMQDIGKKIRRPKAVGLRKRVLSEFSGEISGIHLPNGVVAKHFDGNRVRRVIWKVVRGLFCHHFSMVLHEDARHFIEMHQVQDKPPDIHRVHLANTPLHGQFREVFVYQFAKVIDKDSFASLWALFFWESVVAIIGVIPSETTPSTGTSRGSGVSPQRAVARSGQEETGLVSRRRGP